MEDDLMYQTALDDFHRVRNRAALGLLLARLTGKSIDLLPFDEISRKLKVAGGSDKGLQEIPLNAIVGTVGRYGDFTRDFLPRRSSDAARWARVKSMVVSPFSFGLEPIEVYKIGQVYFVKDGHHRVSVARQMKSTYIQAYVNEIRTKVELTPDIKPEELILKAEYAEFLADTRFDEVFPKVELKITFPGMYKILKEHISVHRYYMGMEMKREISMPEAVKDWYTNVYQPVVSAIQEQGLLHDFPGRTETDLYLWVSDHRTFIEKDYGWKVSSWTAAGDLSERISPRFSRMWQRFTHRVLDFLLPDQLESAFTTGQDWLSKAGKRDRLFSDILVPVNGLAAGWLAMEQSLVLAKAEGARLLGLHIVPQGEVQSVEAQGIRQRFDARCKEAGVAGNLVIEAGEVARIISERAALSDLVVLSLSHPPGGSIVAKLESGYHTILHRSPRPVLAVPDQPTRLDNLLLAYDGSLKGKQALSISAYFAAKWKLPLNVVCVAARGKVSFTTRDAARLYLEERQVEAHYYYEHGNVEDILLRIAGTQKSSLLIMGGYGFSPMLEMVLGSVLDRILREICIPVLVCQ